MTNHDRCHPSTCPLRRVWLVACIVLFAPWLAVAEVERDTVSLVIDYGDGVQLHMPRLSWREGLTVLDTLTAAQAHPHGITFAHRGSGAGALVTRIGDLTNQGGGPMDKNWLFSVNGKPATAGAGALKLRAGDTVLWKFQVYDYNSP